MAMQYGEIPGVRHPVSRIIMGTSWTGFGGEATPKLLDDVFELGCNAIDTAYVYGGGESERAIGRWLASRGVRDKVVIIDKGAHPAEGRNRVTPEDIAADIGESLERLGTDRIDLYLLHRDDESVPVGPVVEALDEHVSAGRINAFGGSNWSAARIAEANAYAAERGLTPMVASSPHFSLAEPREMPWAGCRAISGAAGAADRAYYAESGVAVLCWSAMAGGFLSGRFRRDNLETFTDYFEQLVVKCYCTEANFARLDWVERVAAERGLSAAQVALGWLFSQKELNLYALVACRSAEEMAENIAALEVAGTLPAAS